MKKRAYPYTRFSSKEQEKGDSERRQTELVKESKTWIESLGYQLDDSLNLIDRGLSGFTGAHKRGSWGRFLKLVKEGKISSGSMLVIENMDRLSREDPDQVMSDLWTLKQAGIKVGILDKKVIYDNESEWYRGLMNYIDAGLAPKYLCDIRF